MGSFVGILFFIYDVIYQTIVNKEIDIYEVMFLESLVIILTLLMLSVMIPIQFKYGSEKGKMANLAVMGVGLIIIFATDKIIPTTSVAIMVTEKRNTLSMSAVFILMTIAIYYISMLISQKIINQKEF